MGENYSSSDVNANIERFVNYFEADHANLVVQDIYKLIQCWILKEDPSNIQMSDHRSLSAFKVLVGSSFQTDNEQDVFHQSLMVL